MKRFSFARALLLRLTVSACPPPSRCSYCPVDAAPHWTWHGNYQRYAGDPEDPCRKIAITRYWCKINERTFSLPPDSLLPYCGMRADFIVEYLSALLVEGVGLNTLARQMGVGRSSLRFLRARFLRVLPLLRLAGHEGALKAAAFLRALAATGTAAIVELFRNWKEQEPKHSIVGIYLR